MELGKNIKELRAKHNYSQEDLAELVYVTRQTISKWETDKNYPDINSLILLSKAFNITIDNLIKGDLEIMKQKIESSDIAKIKKYSWLMRIGIAVSAVVMSASWYAGFIPGFVIGIIVFVGACTAAYKVKCIKIQYDVVTYREICAFMKGETLDEIEKARESGKRMYQLVLYVLICMLLGGTISITLYWIFANLVWR